MYDIKWIKDNKSEFEEGLNKRGTKIDSNLIIDLYDNYADKIASLHDLQNARNQASKNIGIKKQSGQDASEDIAEVSKLKSTIAKLQEETEKQLSKINSIVELIPNIPSQDVPEGVNETANKLIKSFGKKRNFSFEPKSHDELGLNLQMMDFEKAADISGSRFVIIKSKLAKLERALATFMLDIHTEKHNYIEINPPSLVRDNTLYGTGQLPKFSDDLFKTTSDHWLIPTAEVPLTNLVSDSISDYKTLPMRFTALTNCYRSEAGSAGKDTKGMMRLHEFKKVELVTISSPEDSEKEHERMLLCAEEILKQLNLPYQVVNLCTGDLGFSASKTYDIESLDSISKCL